MNSHLLKINNLNTTFFSLAIKTSLDNNTRSKALNSIRSVQGDDDRGEAHMKIMKTTYETPQL